MLNQPEQEKENPKGSTIIFSERVARERLAWIFCLGSKLNEYFSYDFTEDKIEEGKELKHTSCDSLNHIQHKRRDNGKFKAHYSE